MSSRMQLDLTRDRAIFGAMQHLGTVAVRSGIEESLLLLVQTRASQINGCAFCIDMHTKDARAAGETEQRLYMLSAWREANAKIYTPRERAALAWTEAVTRLERQQVSDEAYEAARKEFDEKDLPALTLAIVAINGWNRFNVAFQTPAGDYKPGSFAELAKESAPRTTPSQSH